MHSDTEYRNSPELLRADAQAARRVWEQTEQLYGETIDADEARRLLTVFLDGRRPHLTRGTAVQQVVRKYAGTPAALDADYQALLALMHDDAEDFCLRLRAMEVLVKLRHVPAAEHFERMTTDAGLHPEVRSMAVEMLWKLDPSRYRALPDLVFDTTANRDMRLSWLRAAGCVRLTDQDVARMQHYLRENDFRNDSMVRLSMKNAMEAGRRPAGQ